MWERKADRPDALSLLGAIVIQIAFAIYGPYISIWALLQAPEYGYHGGWTIPIGVIAALDLVFLLAMSYRLARVMWTGIGWKHLGWFLCLEVVLTVATGWVVMGPYLSAIGWD